MKLKFCLQININVSYKVTIKHSQSTQSNKFAISLQLLKNKVRKRVQFLHEDKQKFLQVDIIVFDGTCQTCLKHPK